MMIIDVFLVLLGVIWCWTRFTYADGNTRKCITEEDDTVRIKCPPAYVIFDPSAVAGVSDDCSQSSAHCTGLPERLKQQLQKCHWRRQCNITFHKSDTLQCGQHPNFTTEAVTYADIKQPYCIPKEIIIDSYKKKSYIIKKKRGVIRSHKRYPEEQSKPLQPRRIKLLVPPSSTLYIDLQRSTECAQKNDVILWQVKHDRRIRVKEAFYQVKTFNSSVADYLELIVRQVPASNSCLGGFMLPFSSYPTESLTELMEWPKSSFPVIRDLEWIFEVRAVIEQCTVNNPGKAILTCDDDEIIYSPEFSVAGYTRNQPKCIFGRYACGGHTPLSLVQRNSCYWKTECPVTWQGSVPILVSKLPACIGYQASIIGLYGHRCVPKDQVYDVCSNCTETIKAEWGIIRSHPTYPWFFDSEYKYCKRIIQIGKGNKLLVIVQDINLDPDGRDKFTFIHKYKEHRLHKGDVRGAFTLIKQERRTVMTTKEARSGVSVEVSGGRLVVNFRPFRNSKGGRGFVLVFKRYKITTSKQLDDPRQPLRNDLLFNDAAHPVRLRTNRRRCSGNRKKRRRGRGCRARVWTDFFTQLEDK